MLFRREDKILKKAAKWNNCLVFLTTMLRPFLTFLTSGRAPSKRWFFVRKSTDAQTTVSSIFTPENCWAWQRILITKAVNLEKEKNDVFNHSETKKISDQHFVRAC